MLHNVPNSVNRLVRNVVMNHPNTFNCQIFRKHNLRTGDDEIEAVGKSTFGGMGVLSSEDEENYEYEYMGNGFALPADQFASAPMVDHHDANIGAENEFRFLIVLEAQETSDDYFDIKNHDIMYLLFGEEPHTARLAYEIVGAETTSNIPPYTMRYICNRRDDLHLPAE